MHCDWGRERLAQGTQDDGHAGPGVLRVVIGLVFSLGFVLGPYVAMCVLVPEVMPWMHFTYWAAMLRYLMGAAVLIPAPVMSELGWLGGLIDNPFSWEDDANRHALGLALVLMPGKAVVWTLVAVGARLRRA